MFEKPEKEKLEKEPSAEKLKSLILEIAEKSRAEGIPVGDDCRIQEDAYQQTYTQEEIERDKFLVRNKAKEEGFELGDNERSGRGIELEQLKTILFHKNAASSLIAVRASQYDDYYGDKVDNVLVHRSSGLPICALDEVVDTKERMYEKQERIIEKNRHAGGSLKYGISLDSKDGKITLGGVVDIPVFYLATSPKFVERTVHNMEPSLGRQSAEEKFLFHYFLISLKTQIKQQERKYQAFQSRMVAARIKELDKILESEFEVSKLIREFKLGEVLDKFF